MLSVMGSINGLRIYALVAVGYTILVPVMFRDPIFSLRNAKSAESVVLIHGLFLAIALEFTWIAIRIYPSLPDWMTSSGLRGSLFDELCIGFAAILAAVERPRIYSASASPDLNLISRVPEDIDPADELNGRD